MNESDLERIKSIEERLDVLENLVRNMETPTTTRTPPSSLIKDLLALPSSLQKTMIAVQKLEEGTATDVSKITQRVRSVETIYLNQLARLGYLTKSRKGRRIYFKVLRYY